MINMQNSDSILFSGDQRSSGEIIIRPEILSWAYRDLWPYIGMLISSCATPGVLVKSNISVKPVGNQKKRSTWLLVTFGVLEQHVGWPINLDQCPVKDLFYSKLTLRSCSIYILANGYQPTAEFHIRRTTDRIRTQQWKKLCFPSPFNHVMDKGLIRLKNTMMLPFC